MQSALQHLTIGSSREDRSVFLETIVDELENVINVPVDRELFLLAVSEALDNAAEHGNNSDTDKPIQTDRVIKNGIAAISIKDDGKGFICSSPGTQTSLDAITGPRGRGIALIRENAHNVFFNRVGNRIILTYGGHTMKAAQDNWNADVSALPGNIIMVTNLEFSSEKTSIVTGFSDLFDQYHKSGVHYLIDMRTTKLISSMAWGTLFAQSERNDVQSIYLFNCGEAIRRTAQQMGINQRGAPYDKIHVEEDCSAILDLIGRLAGE